MANGEVRKARKEVKEARVKKKVDKKVAKAKLKKAFKNAIGDKVGVAKAKRKLKKTQLKGAKKLLKKTSMYGEDAGKRVGMDLSKSNFEKLLKSRALKKNEAKAAGTSVRKKTKAHVKQVNLHNKNAGNPGRVKRNRLTGKVVPKKTK